MNRKGEGDVVVVMFVAVLALGIIALGMWGLPRWGVYRQALAGEAELRRAEQNRQVAIQEAKAKEEASRYLAAAETTRAHGVAAANHIIGSSLRDNEGYLRYLWIHTLNDSSKQVIYVPTEAGLPILEAGHRRP